MLFEIFSYIFSVQFSVTFKLRYYFSQRTDGTRMKMDEFVFTYLQRRFSLEQMIVEWGYNLHDACQRYSHDPIIGLFSSILNDEVSHTESCRLIVRLVSSVFSNGDTTVLHWAISVITVLPHTGMNNTSMAKCKTAVTPLLTHWSYCSLALSYWQ